MSATWTCARQKIDLLLVDRLSDICQAEVVQLPLVAHEETRQPGHHDEDHRKKENDASSATRYVEMEQL